MLHGRYKTVTLAAALLVLVTAASGRAQQSGWQGEERLTDDEGTALVPPNNGKYIAVDSIGRIHVVWTDNRDKNFEVYHKFKEGGVWSTDERVTFNTAYSERPVIVAGDLGLVHLVWNDLRDGNKEIYHAQYNFGWGNTVRVTDTPGNSFASSIAWRGSTLHLVHLEVVGGFNEVMYRTFHSPHWSDAVALTAVGAGNRMVPTIALGGDGSVHVAWWDTRPDSAGSTSGKIYYRMKDGSWTPEELASDPSGDAMRPNIAVDGSGCVHIVWIDARDYFEQIYYRRRGSSGWEPEVQLTSGDCTHYHPSIAVVGTDVYVAYWDNHLGETNSEVFFRSCIAGTWSGPLRISEADGPSTLCCLIAEPTGNLHVAWIDGRDLNDEVYYRAYVDPSTGVDDQDDPDDPPPAVFPLALAVRPNPFRSQTSIELSLPAAGTAEVTIFDVAGRRVRALQATASTAGTLPLVWNGADRSGRRVPPGIYLVVARIGKQRVVSKAIHVR